MNIKDITICTRRSPLAIKQTELVVNYLKNIFKQCTFHTLELQTSGDKQQEWSLQEKGGKGLFTKELEEALLQKKAHIAVHSAKDLPTQLPDKLTIAGFLKRENAQDILITQTLEPKHIATSSPRRQAQLKKLFPEAIFSSIRGNIHTRLNKIKENQADATVLAAAGLHRLGLAHYPNLIFKYLSIHECVPAAGQGAIALECTEEFAPIIANHLDQDTMEAVTIERSFLKALGGGCHSAFAAHYAKPTLYIFHEKTGYIQFNISVPDLNEVDHHMSHLVKKILQ